MTNSEVMDIFYEFFIIAVRLAGPVLIISMAVGLTIAIFQAATQIHEQTVTFVPKLLFISLILLFLGNNMLVTIQEYARKLFSMM